MATVNKDFKIKSGLIVEGTTATVNGYDILTKKQDDQDYIVGLIGGTATSANEANKVVKRDASGNFAAGTITADLTGQVSDISNHDTDDLAEGSRLYFTNQRALDATNAAYDAAGDAAYEAGLVASDLSDHENATVAHGVTGNVVGTTDTQTLTNKTIGDTLNFTGAGAMTINSDSHIVLTPAAGSSVKWGSDVLATENYVDGEISTEVTNRNTAITNALTTAQGYATTAQGNAETYAEGVAGAVQDNLDDHTSATSAHGVTGNIVGTTDTQTISNKTLGSDLAAGGYKVSGLADPTANQDSATKAYVDGAISDLVDSAPELLDTLNELALAIASNPNYASDIASSLGEKVAKAGDSMTGDLDFGGTHKVTSLATPTNSADAATKGYVDGEITTALSTASGYASDAQDAAELYADGVGTAAVTTANSYTDGEITTALSTASGYADAVASDLSDHEALSSGVHGVTGSVVGTTDSQDLSNKRFINTTYFTDGVTISDEGQIAVLSPSHEFEVKANVGPLGLKSYNDDIVLTPGSGKDVKWGADVLATQAYVDNQTTSDVAEGTNEYFTDGRAKTSAADLLTGASLTNITITGNGSGLTITAENGVADSDTDDLVEGTTNKYFTDVRAVDALEAVVPNFTAVEVNSVAKQVAATVSCPVAGINQAYGFDPEVYRSAEFLVKVAYGNHTEISKVLLTLDINDNIAMTEYGIVGTNGSASSISADISGGEVRLLATTSNNNSTVTVMGTLLV
jgi:hypothetical protein